MKSYLYIYGINSVVQSLLNPLIKVNKLYLWTKIKNNNFYLKLAKNRKIKVLFCSKEKITIIAKTEKHQNLVLEIYKPQNYLLSSITINSLKKKFPFLLILDQINNPYNFGAILRTCDLFNVDGVIILNKRQVDINSTIIKTSSGVSNYVPICRVNNLTNAIIYLKKRGFWIYSTNLNKNAQNVRKLKYNNPICLIVGNEKKGVSKKILKNADFNIFIPTNGHINSLNVSVASAVLIYQIKMLQK